MKGLLERSWVSMVGIDIKSMMEHGVHRVGCFATKKFDKRV